MTMKTQTAMRADPHQMPAQENTRDDAADNVTNKKEDLIELQQIFAGLSAAPPHKLVQETKKRLAKAKPDGNSILQAPAIPCLDIRVSHACMDRALDLLNTLFAVLEQRGFSIQVRDEKNSARPVTCLKLAGEEIQVHIEEKLDRVEHVLTEAEKKKLVKKESLSSRSGRYGGYSNNWELYSWEPSKWDYRLSSKLEFKIDNLESSGQRQNWSDTTRRQLEIVLPNIAYHVLDSVAYLRKCRLEREERERRREEEERQRLERERRRLEEQKKVEHLDKLLGQWSKRGKILRFLSWLDDNVSEDERTEDFIEWYEWAKSYAERLNPLAKQEFYKPEQRRYWY